MAFSFLHLVAGSVRTAWPFQSDASRRRATPSSGGCGGRRPLDGDFARPGSRSKCAYGCWTSCTVMPNCFHCACVSEAVSTYACVYTEASAWVHVKERLV